MQKVKKWQNKQICEKQLRNVYTWALLASLANIKKGLVVAFIVKMPILARWDSDSSESERGPVEKHAWRYDDSSESSKGRPACIHGAMQKTYN